MPTAAVRLKPAVTAVFTMIRSQAGSALGRASALANSRRTTAGSGPRPCADCRKPYL